MSIKEMWTDDHAVEAKTYQRQLGGTDRSHFRQLWNFRPRKELQIREVSCMPLNLWKFGLRSSSELNTAGSNQRSIRMSCCSPQPTLIRWINRLKAGHFLGPGLHTPTAIFAAVLQLCDDDYSPFHRGSNYEFCCS